MGRSSRVSVIELLGVESETKGGLDTGAKALGISYTIGVRNWTLRKNVMKPTKSDDTRVVNLGLDERGGVKVSLGADLKSDTAVGGL